MYYYCYRTTNLINGKYYLGIHHSVNPEKDSYLGSGIGLRNAIRKYGKENFKVEILKYFNNLEEAYDFEYSLVNSNTLDSKTCYNRIPGGKGCGEGVIYMHKGSQEIRVHESLQKYYEEQEYIKGRSNQAIQNVSLTHKGKPSKQKGRIYVHKGFDIEVRVKPEDIGSYLKQGYELGHSELAKQKVREKHLGRVWVSDGCKEKSVSLEELGGYLQLGYRKGKLPRTEAHKNALSKSMKGKVQSEETRLRKSLAKKGRTWKVIEGKRVWSEKN